MARAENRPLHYALLLGLTCIAHGLLLLNDGIYWDDWFLHVALSQHNWSAIAFLGQRGIPLDPWFYWIVGYGGQVFTFKLVRFVCIAAGGILIYESCIATRRVPSGQALAIVALAITYPGDETPVIQMDSDYSFYLLLFWIAVLLGFLSEDPDRSATGRRTLAACSIVLFLLSFNLNSLLVFYFGFLFVLFLLMPQPRRLALRHIVFFTIPFLFWLAHILIFPARGYFAAYNRLHLNPLLLIKQLLHFGWFAGVLQMNNTLQELLRFPLLTIGVTVLASALFPILHPERFTFELKAAGRPGRLAFAVGLAFAAIVPYAVAGKAPVIDHGPNTRCELLLAVPVACFVVWAIAALFRIRERLSRAAFVALILILAAFTARTIHTYLSWQAEWAREQAIVSSLAQQRQGIGFATLWVCEEGLQSNPYFVTGIDALVLAAWGAESGVTIDARWNGGAAGPKDPDEFQHPGRVFVLPGERPTQVIPPVATLSLCVPTLWSDSELAAKYLTTRFFHASELPLLYGRIAHVQIRPGPPQLHQRCCAGWTPSQR